MNAGLPSRAHLLVYEYQCNYRLQCSPHLLPRRLLLRLLLLASLSSRYCKLPLPSAAAAIALQATLRKHCLSRCLWTKSKGLLLHAEACRALPQSHVRFGTAMFAKQHIIPLHYDYGTVSTSIFPDWSDSSEGPSPRLRDLDPAHLTFAEPRRTRGLTVANRTEKNTSCTLCCGN